MYLNITSDNIKELSQTVFSKIEQMLKDKNMEYQDVKIVLSVELKDETHPSKTVIEFHRIREKIETEAFDSIKSLFSGIKTKFDDTKTDDENKKIAKDLINGGKDTIDQLKVSTEQEMIDLFKRMLIDPDNKLCIIVNNRYISITEDVDYRDFASLPQSIQDLVNNNKLSY